jgi:hypothetical protein
VTLDRHAYDATTIDWPQLLRYAKLVASESTKPRPTTTQRYVETASREKTWFFGLVRWTAQEPSERVEEVDLDYWVLEKRWNRTSRVISKDPRYEVQERTITKYCLRVDGSLFKYVNSEIEITNVASQIYDEVRPDGDPYTSPLTAEDVMLFDFEPWYYKTRRDDDTLFERNDMQGTQLRYHAKGVGFSRLLKSLLLD